MEIRFQQEQKVAVPMGRSSKSKGRSRSSSNNKYVGVRQRPSGRWVAEIKDTTQKIRMWLGTFETAEAAARAYDEAACLLRGSNARTNFVTHVSPDSPLALRITNLLNNRKNAKQSAQSSSKATTTSASTIHIPSNSCITSSSSTSSPTRSGDSNSSVEYRSCQKAQQNNHLFDDAYKPDLSNCSEEFDNGSSQSGMSWGLEQGFVRFSFGHDHHQLLDLPKNVGLPETADQLDISEFELMKVERQISASLYAMNGVQEYMGTVCDPMEALWDLPPLCSLLS